MAIYGLVMNFQDYGPHLWQDYGSRITADWSIALSAILYIILALNENIYSFMCESVLSVAMPRSYPLGWPGGVWTG